MPEIMQVSGRVALKALTFVLVSGCFNFAHSATVFNLSDKSQTIEVKGEHGFEPVVIEPNRNFRRVGRWDIKYNGQLVRLDEYDEYAIWKNGDFGPQKYHTHSRGSSQF